MFINRIKKWCCRYFNEFNKSNTLLLLSQFYFAFTEEITTARYVYRNDRQTREASGINYGVNDRIFRFELAVRQPREDRNGKNK